jgi:hypothetical protein
MKKNTHLIFSFIFFLLIILSSATKTAADENNVNCNCNTSLPIKIKNIKTDFGAKGNNNNDDTWSFMLAADWLNKNCGEGYILKLEIPEGTYLVGLQLAPNQKISNPFFKEQSFTNMIGHTRKGINIVDLINAKNIIISGSSKTIIKYKKGLYFGGFDKNLKPVSYVPSSSACSTTKDASNVATIGTFISLKNCSCVNIEGLYIDGNNKKINLGGVYGECNGYEIGHDGIDILGSRNVLIKNVSCNNFGRDGIMSLNLNQIPDCIHLVNVTSDQNSRQGFSITAGTNFTIENCSFSKTGTVFYNNPGAGVDIEPEFDGRCSSIIFSKCKFLDNVFCGMISDNHFPNVSDITFNDCEFTASYPQSWSIWPRSMIHTVFNNCIIRGRMTHVAGTDSSDHMQFNKCTITDWRKGVRDKLSYWGGYLMDFGTPAPDDHFYEFNFCDFEIHKSLAITTVENKSGNANRVFNQCKWNFYVDDLLKIIPHFPDSPARGFIGRFVNCTLNSNTFNEMKPAKTNKRLYFIEVAPDNNTTDKKNTFAPQDGMNNNKFSRIQNNPGWMWTYAFSLRNF